MHLTVSNVAVVACLLGFAGLLWWLEDAGLNERGGPAQVIDGDSLLIGGERVRLKSIDAPEGRQMCEKNGSAWRCGRAASKALQELVRGKEVICEGQELDRYDRLLAYCRVGAVDLNRTLVRQGWAVAFGDRYFSEERAAQARRVGLWQGSFQRPAAWRAQQRGLR